MVSQGCICVISVKKEKYGDRGIRNREIVCECFSLGGANPPRERKVFSVPPPWKVRPKGVSAVTVPSFAACTCTRLFFKKKKKKTKEGRKRKMRKVSFSPVPGAFPSLPWPPESHYLAAPPRTPLHGSYLPEKANDRRQRVADFTA